MTDSIYIHTINGAPAVYDERTERIFYSGKVIRHFAESYDQIVRERRAAIRSDMADGAGPYRYSHVRIPRAVLRRGSDHA